MQEHVRKCKDFLVSIYKLGSFLNFLFTNDKYLFRAIDM